MLTALILSVFAMTIIVGVRYLAVSGAFAWLTDRRLPGFYDGRSDQIRKEIGWSLASVFIYAAPAGLLAWGWQARGWTRIYADVTDYPLWWLPGSVVVCLLLPASCFTGSTGSCIGLASTRECMRFIMQAGIQPRGRR